MKSLKFNSPWYDAVLYFCFFQPWMCSWVEIRVDIGPQCTTSWGMRRWSKTFCMYLGVPKEKKIVPSKICLPPSFSASYPIISISAAHTGGVLKVYENRFLFSIIHAVDMSCWVVHSCFPWDVIWNNSVTVWKPFRFTRAMALPISRLVVMRNLSFFHLLL